MRREQPGAAVGGSGETFKLTFIVLRMRCAAKMDVAAKHDVQETIALIPFLGLVVVSLRRHGRDERTCLQIPGWDLFLQRLLLSSRVIADGELQLWAGQGNSGKI